MNKYTVQLNGILLSLPTQQSNLTSNIDLPKRLALFQYIIIYLYNVLIIQYTPYIYSTYKDDETKINTQIPYEVASMKHILPPFDLSDIWTIWLICDAFNSVHLSFCPSLYLSHYLLIPGYAPLELWPKHHPTWSRLCALALSFSGS